MSKDVKKENKEKKHFFKDVKTELKRVIWPSPKQLANNKVAVITIVLITAIIVFALDFAFESMNKFGIDNIKKAVQSSNETTNTVINEQTQNTQTNAIANTENTSTNEVTQNNTVNE